MSQDLLTALFEAGDEQGCVNLSYLNEIVADLELEESEVDRIYERLEERRIEITDDCRRPEAEAEQDTTYINGDLAHATTDALQEQSQAAQAESSLRNRVAAAAPAMATANTAPSAAASAPASGPAPLF